MVASCIKPESKYELQSKSVKFLINCEISHEVCLNFHIYNLMTVVCFTSGLTLASETLTINAFEGNC